MANNFDEIMIDLPNIRCVTCGKVIGHLHDKMVQLRTKNYTNEEIFEELGLGRPCCRVALIYPPKYSMVGIVDEEKPSRNSISERSKGHGEDNGQGQGADKAVGLRNKLMQLKEKNASQEPVKKKTTMCYYAI